MPPMPLLGWILAGALAAAVVLIVLLALGYRRARTRAAQLDDLVTAARRAVRRL